MPDFTAVRLHAQGEAAATSSVIAHGARNDRGRRALCGVHADDGLGMPPTFRTCPDLPDDDVPATPRGPAQPAPLQRVTAREQGETCRHEACSVVSFDRRAGCGPPEFSVVVPQPRPLAVPRTEP